MDGSPVQTAVERTGCGCWPRWFCGGPSIRIEEDVENCENEPLRSASLQKEQQDDFKESSVLEETEEQLRWSTERLEELSQENLQLRAALEQKDKDLRQTRKRCNELSLETQNLRSALDQRDKLQQRLSELSQKNQELRSTLEQTDKAFRESVKRSSCQRCEHQAQEHRQQMSEMEQFYKDKLTEARSALKEKDEEFRSFKDRVAENMVLSLKTDNTENMNSPVNQSRLTEMYQQLRVCTWPSIKFTSPPHKARTLVREMFAAAAEHMKRPLETLEKVCAVKGPSPKVEKFRQTALENLQLALYHSSKEDVFQAVFPLFPGGAAEWDLASECFWLGCLMELHCPPLHPHWGRADEDHRTVFPRDIRAQKGLRHRVTVL